MSLDNKIILLMRHGEKYESELSKEGIVRSKFLPEYFLDWRPNDIPFPTHIIAMKPRHKTSSTRCVDTVKHMACMFELPFLVKYTKNQINELIEHVSNLPSKSVILICWEHVKLVDIAKELKAPVRNWNSTPISLNVDTKKFNIIWKIQYNKFQSFNTFDIEGENIIHYMFPKKEEYTKFI